MVYFNVFVGVSDMTEALGENPDELGSLLDEIGYFYGDIADEDASKILKNMGKQGRDFVRHLMERIESEVE